MTPHDETLATLREAVARGIAVLVAGTGVAISASIDPTTGKPHPQASWSGLLEDGLNWLREHDLMDANQASAHLILLRDHGDTYHFVSAAQDITKLMGGVGSQHFADWLKRTVGSIQAHDREVLAALQAFRRHKNVLATTNYDDLLLADDESLKPVTWKDTDALLPAVRNPDTSIVFLHGYWRLPDTVVLDWTSYQQLARNETYRQDLATVWQMTTWIYVGCGINGLNDPDFGLLLERYGKRARQAGLWDYCLVRNEQRAEFQAHFDKLQVNIHAVPFGDDYRALPAFLKSLLPAPGPQAAPVAVSRPTPVEPITEFLRVTDSFFQYRAPAAASGAAASGHRGDFRFTAEEFRSGAVHRAQVVNAALDRLQRDGLAWLEGPSAGGKTTVCLHLVNEWDHHGCAPLYLDLADEPDAEQAAREITASAELGRMFILDNVHDAPKVACVLLDHWRTQRRDSVIVLLGWPTTVTSDHDYLSGYRHTIVPVAVQAEDWIGVYQSTYRLVRGPTHVPPVPPPQVVRQWDDTFAADLVTFQYALSAGLRLDQGTAFHVEVTAANRYVQDKYLAPCSDAERRDLFLLAWSEELGVRLGEECAPSRFTHSLGCGLIRSTFHGRIKNHIRYQPWHRSFARLLLGLAPQDDRRASLCQAAAAFPFSAGVYALRLRQHGELRLAEEVFAGALAAHPSLVDWCGDTLCIMPVLLRQTREMMPGKWPEACARITEPTELKKLCTLAFATPLHFLVTFLQFARQTKGLELAYAALAKALAADAILPMDQSRLVAQALATPLHFLVTFLRFVGKTEGLTPIYSALAGALAVDAALPAGQSRLLAQAIAAPLGELTTFLRYAGPTDGLTPVGTAVARALAADAALPASQSRLLAQAMAAPLGELTTLLRYARQTEELTPVCTAVANELAADAALPADQSRLLVRVFATSLGDLAMFLDFTRQVEGLKPAYSRVAKALASDAALPAGQSRLLAQAFATPLHFLSAFLRFVRHTEGLTPVYTEMAKALAADAASPADRSRLLAQVMTAPLGELTTFLRFARQAKELTPVYSAVATALAADAALPADQSRLLARAIATPLGDLAIFLEFTSQPEGLKPVYSAVATALTIDVALPVERSRLLAVARTTQPEHLRGFITRIRTIPSLRSLAEAVARDAICAKALGHPTEPTPHQSVGPTRAPESPRPADGRAGLVPSAPALFPSALDQQVRAGIERVLKGAWEAVPEDTEADERFRVARGRALRIISGLSPYIKRQVSAHFQNQRWEPLRSRDPKA